MKRIKLFAGLLAIATSLASCTSDSQNWEPTAPVIPEGNQIIYTALNIADQGPNKSVLYQYKLIHNTIPENSENIITDIKVKIANELIYEGTPKQCYTYSYHRLYPWTSGQSNVIPAAVKTAEIIATYENGSVITYNETISFVQSLEAVGNCD